MQSPFEAWDSPWRLPAARRRRWSQLLLLHCPSLELHMLDLSALSSEQNKATTYEGKDSVEYCL